nr:response regulator [Caulobacter hibisci]
MVVEDEMVIAWLLTEMLDELGCHVVGPACTVGQALETIDREAFDAALLDVNLNGQFSYPVADVLAARSIPFMFSTGYDRSRIREGYRDAPMLQKPYHSTELEGALTLLFAPGGGQAAPIAA